MRLILRNWSLAHLWYPFICLFPYERLLLFTGSIRHQLSLRFRWFSFPYIRIASNVSSSSPLSSSHIPQVVFTHFQTPSNHLSLMHFSAILVLIGAASVSAVNLAVRQAAPPGTCCHPRSFFIVANPSFSLCRWLHSKCKHRYLRSGRRCLPMQKRGFLK